MPSRVNRRHRPVRVFKGLSIDCQPRLGIFPDSAFCRKCRMRHSRHRFAVQTLLRWYRNGEESHTSEFEAGGTRADVDYCCEIIRAVSAVLRRENAGPVASRPVPEHCRYGICTEPAMGIEL